VRLILNADDFGASEDTVASTVACFEAGLLTSATIMARMPATTSAVTFARDHPEHSFGVHLTLTGSGDERPVSDPRDVPHLVDDDGCFPATAVVRARALARRLPLNELERELSAQIAVVRDGGVPVSHVDSHQHLHKFAAVRRALERVLPAHRLTRVRAVQDVYLRRPVTSPTYWLGRRWAASISSRFATTEHLYMPATAGDSCWTGVLDLIEDEAGERILEVGAHPGPDGWRSVERDALPEFVETALARGHRLTTWHDVGAGLPRLT
jgi:predicted glycoside hydrolase/deacetylase ChbG (UPF0249 family)